MITFIKRNLKIFFRDKSAVCFSLLGVFVIIGLYVLFLGDIYTGDLNGIEGAREIMDCWVMAGILAVTSVTTTMGAFGIMINDKITKGIKDFYVAPIKRSSLACGYLGSAYIIGMLMSVIAFVIAEVYIVANGGALISVGAACKVMGLMILTCFMNTALVFLLVSFFQSTNAFTTASTIIGALIGFITGIYLPIGMFPEGVQWIIKLFPVSQAASLFRQVMMEDVMSRSFASVPKTVVQSVKEELGVVFMFGDTQMTAAGSIFILIATSLACVILAMLKASAKNKR